MTVSELTKVGGTSYDLEKSAILVQDEKEERKRNGEKAPRRGPKRYRLPTAEHGFGGSTLDYGKTLKESPARCLLLRS